jgi:hypothetical protein
MPIVEPRLPRNYGRRLRGLAKGPETVKTPNGPSSFGEFLLDRCSMRAAEAFFYVEVSQGVFS